MKNNMIYKEALELIESSHYILILTHVNPDPDTLSCSLALSNYFTQKNIKHKVFNKSSTLPKSVDFLKRFDKITNQIPKFYDLVIYVDCGDKKRPGIETDPKAKIINIDHHQSNDNFGNINIVDSNKASTAEVLYNFFSKNNLTLSKEIAECLYVGIFEDSLHFTTPRVDANTFTIIQDLVCHGAKPGYIANMLTQRESLAKYRLLPKILNSLELHMEGEIATIYVLPKWLEETGANYYECEEAVDMILNISVVNIAIFLRLSNDKVRISLRSKNNHNVAQIAQNFNGGGHKMSAGCLYHSSDIMEAKDVILDYIRGNKLEEKK